MIVYRLVIVISLAFLELIACSERPEKSVAVQLESDSLQMDNDSLDNTSLAGESCYEKFFAGLSRFEDSGTAVLLLPEGKRASLTQFFKEEFMSPVSAYGKKDLDQDGVDELIVFNNTGGAHCCDEYHIFHQKAENEFEFKAHMMGGQTCIDPATNRFNYSFSETLGYFFGCYACEFQDSTGAFRPMRDIFLTYSNGTLEVTPYDPTSEQQNLANLEVLQKHGFEKIEGMMDTGWRKEFAMNFAVWHFNHGKDWSETQKLFSKYYNFSDSAKVWKEFYTTITESEKDNTF